MSLYSFLNRVLGDPRSKLVVRLYEEGHITPHEFNLLMSTKTVVNIDKIEVSSGAKVVCGDVTQTQEREAPKNQTKQTHMLC